MDRVPQSLNGRLSGLRMEILSRRITGHRYAACTTYYTLTLIPSKWKKLYALGVAILSGKSFPDQVSQCET